MPNGGSPTVRQLLSEMHPAALTELGPVQRRGLETSEEITAVPWPGAQRYVGMGESDPGAQGD